MLRVGKCDFRKETEIVTDGYENVLVQTPAPLSLYTTKKGDRLENFTIVDGFDMKGYKRHGQVIVSITHNKPLHGYKLTACLLDFDLSDV